ncbi:hypothetical protein [Algibacter aquimarinus]
MKYFLLIISFFLLSCGNKKVLQLPEISTSEITEINDVSHAYLFYDETKEDSLELNRKNLISTTNWLVNVDKRLTLKQAIPHIKYLQDKKDNSSHKNKNAKNYFTCNDVSRKNLGFVEFTDVNYSFEQKKIGSINSRKSNVSLFIRYQSKDSITIFTDAIKCIVIIAQTNCENILNDLKKAFPESSNKEIELNLKINPNITFQEYISFKSTLIDSDLNYIHLSNNELIFN